MEITDLKRLVFKTPFDYKKSPFSGWGYTHWEEAFFNMMAAVVKSASRNKARQLIPGPRSHHGQLADELEGFTRAFIMAGPWLNSSDTGVFTLDGEIYDVGGFYREGILAGTDPENDEYWGDIHDYDQHLVEMASLSWSLYLSKKHVWDRFTDSEKKQVADYLFQCTKVKYHENNWLLFNVVTNTVLKELDMPYSGEQIKENLRFCNTMYLGDGWYRDGNVNRIDYYNAWAFLYYYLVWGILDGDSDPEFFNTIKERVREFVKGFRYFFGSDGSVPCFGRSMIYRFGYLSPIALGRYLGILDMEAGEVKTMMNLGIKFFLEKEILTDSGHLGMGFIKPNAGMLEHYSCGGSPYWAAKAFNIFLIPPDDPFWTEEEKPLPIHKGDYSHPLRAPGFLLLGNSRTGHVQLLNQKSRHDKPEYNAKYTNFAYSSVFSYESRRIYGNINCDNSLQFSADGINFRQRWKTDPLYCEEDFIASGYPMYEVDEQGRIETFTVVKDHALINIHYIRTDKKIWFREGPYALGFDGGEYKTDSLPGIEAAYAEGKLTCIKNLYGWTEQHSASPYYNDVNGTNVRYSKSVLPYLAHVHNGGGHFILADIICSRIGNDSIYQLSKLVEGFETRGNLIFMHMYDGEKVVLQVGDAEYIDEEINGFRVSGRIALARISSEGELIRRVEALPLR